MIISKLTSKARTTIPLAVRTALHLKEGEMIAYQIQTDRVVITRASREPVETSFATFAEWAGEADQKAYADL